LSGLNKGNKTLIVASTANFNVGDYIRIKEDGNTLTTSVWAFDYLYQMAKIAAISGNTITIEKPLRLTFNAALNPKIIKIDPVQKVGIENISIQRLDSSASQTSIISFKNAANCWIKGVQSYKSNFAHFLLVSSIHCTLEGNYIHDAFGYGENGQGYGVVMQFGASENLVYNNIAKHLRHSFLLQAAANGNVIAYNYSLDPFWVQPSLPSNSAGDIVLHGNYVFTNLIEGNICQNIIIDNSHGINGPYNTFFRNRAELFGIIMNDSSGSKMNFVGNEVTNSTFLYGNYLLTGSNFQYGNNIKSSIIPTGTISLPENTLIGIPYNSFIGIPNVLNVGTNDAKTRWSNSGSKTVNNGIFYCRTDTSDLINTITNKNNSISKFSIYPNPSDGKCKIEFDVNEGNDTYLQMLNISGQILFTHKLNAGNIHFINTKQSIANGTYQLQIIQNNVLVAVSKMEIVKK
jgi:hypothetical protein